MILRLSNSWKPTATEWDQVWNECPYATYFHSREWAEIWEESSQSTLRPSPLVLEISNGTTALLPFSSAGKGITESHISSPGGTFGGWIAKRSLSELEQQVVTTFIQKHYPNLVWRLNPYEEILQPIKFGSVTKEVTHSLDLSGGFDSIIGKWTKGHVSAARKASASGVQIVLAKSKQDWQKYYAVYENSLIRWGKKATSKYDWRFFNAMHERQSSNIKLWMAVYMGEPIAGAICLYSKRHAIYWHGAALAEQFSLRPVNLLIQEAIRDAVVSGFRWFDFNPSGGNEGVTAFKRSFGATAMSADVITTRSPMRILIDTAHAIHSGLIRP